MADNRGVGDKGEISVSNRINCPNCGRKLILLPPNYPLYDIQCSGCSFRAQIKTSTDKPNATVRGAGWIIMEKVLKAGFITPPLIVNFNWIERGKKKQEIRLYPFIPKQNLKPYKIGKKAIRRGYKMFNYINLDKIPFFTLYPKTSKKYTK